MKPASLLLFGSAAFLAALAGRKLGQAPRGSLALATLAQAQIDLNRGVREEGGKNMGPAVAEYGKPFNLAPPLAWCAAATSAWIRRGAAAVGVEPPAQSVMAQGIMKQLQAQGRFIPASAITEADLTPGTLVFWSRQPNPAVLGHVGVLEKKLGPSSFQTIEGNSGPAGDRVARMARNLNGYPGHQLLGLGKLDGGPLRVDAPSIAFDAQLSPFYAPYDDEGQPFHEIAP